jgi:hypothetical protein
MLGWLREVPFWLREVAGWFLVGGSLWLFYLCWQMVVEDRKFLSAGPFLVIGLFLFRGGLHLLKVAVAARVCNQAHDRLTATPVKKYGTADARR